MEAFWQQARQPALRIWRQGESLRCEPNAAALDWAAGQGFADAALKAAWQGLAPRVLAAPDAQPRRWQFGEAGPVFTGQAIVVADGALLWWSPAGDDRLERTLRRAGVSVWQVDGASGRLLVDPRGANPLSVAPPVEGVPLQDLRARVHPDDQKAVRRAAEEALHSGRPIDLVTRYRMLDGSWRSMLTRRVAAEDGGASGDLLGVSLDLGRMATEREHMMSAAEAAGLGLWSQDEDSELVEWNPPMYRIHHRDPALGPPRRLGWWEQCVHPLDRERIRRELEEAERLWPAVTHCEFRIGTPDGGVRWVYSWTRRELRNGRRSAFGLHLDVSERRDAEQALQRERERSLFALDVAGIGVWRRIDAVNSYWSEGMYRLRGLAPDDPRPVREIGLQCLHPDDRPAWLDMQNRYRRELQQDTPHEWEFRVIWPDGSEHWLVSRGRAVCDEQGQPLYMTGVNVDVTERHRAQALLLESQRLEQLKRAQSEFLARVSHELRTPMNAVLGFAQLMSYDASEPLGARQGERLARIEAAGRHLLGLIDDVLDLARIDAQRQPLSTEPVGLHGLVREALEWVAAQAQASGITLRVAQTPLAGRVLADRRRLGQVLLNLLTNAIKYNRPQGWVEVDSAARGQMEDGDGPAQWGLIVRDSGRGLTAEQCRHVFEPFNRLGAERENIAGTGIGLAIARELCDRMGGSIEVSSTPGAGSEFRVWLSADEDASLPMPLDELPAPVSATRTLRLLCVEDNPANQRLVRELLALRPQVQLSCAADGHSAIELALRLRPEVVLLDMQLPDMHGSQVLLTLRGRPELAGCRFIAFSANAMPEDVASALAQGFDDYWTKPIEVPRFLRGIDALLRD